MVSNAEKRRLAGRIIASLFDKAVGGGQHYSQLKAIADDVDDARVYGGIHWRFDQVGGSVLGRAIATEVVKNNLRPVHP